jgi:hypothetical protein
LIVGTPLQTFTEGYDRLRGDYEYRGPGAPKGIPPAAKEYWLADKNAWWLPDLSWVVVEGGLGLVDAGLMPKIEAVFTEVSRMWEVLKPTSPMAVWDPFTWRWMIAKRVPVPVRPTPGPGSGPNNPDPQSDRERRRAHRDARIAEVNRLYEQGKPPISRDVRDQQIAEILDDYPDLN